MRLYNPFRFLTPFEWGLWIFSLVVITLSFFLGGGGALLSLIASLLGVTALIFISKGDVTGQVLIILFSVLYAIVSWEQKYYGEMITYLCMSAPIAAFSVISWLRHPFAADRAEVHMVRLTRKHAILTVLLAAGVTFAFYWILRALGNAALLVSTLSVTTSFLAAYLLFLRSPWYALGYAANDVVLVVLWIIASVKDRSSLSMVACFSMFLLNDLYGFFNWLRLRRAQERASRKE